MNPELVILVILYALLAFQLGYMIFFFTAFPRSKKSLGKAKEVPVSLVVCARNELANLKKHIPVWLNQTHSDYEIVIVNDRSWDGSDEYLDAMAEKHPQIKVRHLRDFDRNWVGKKFALTIGIKAATHERVVLTDADCRPFSSQWLSLMSRYARKNPLVLGYGAYEGKGLVGLLTQFETQMAALHWMSWANRGMAYMGVGRNMSYTKSIFMKENGFSKHMHLPSGDDDLFISSASRNHKAQVCLDPRASTISTAPKSWKEWFQQKRRHLSTSAYYPAIPKFFLGGWGASSLLMYLMLIVSPWLFKIHIAHLAALASRWLVLQIFVLVASVRLKKWWAGLFLLFFEPLLLLSQLYLHRTNRSRGIRQQW